MSPTAAAAERTAQVAAALATRTDGSAAESFELWTVDVPAAGWADALQAARDDFDLAFFDWLSAVDEQAEGFSVVCHLADPDTHAHLLLRTRIPAQDPSVATATGVFRGASWHERETHEMFGIDFAGHPDLRPLLLPDGFEGQPLRKDFVLAARVAKPFPGAKEPGESDRDAPVRRKTLPPGVPDPATWGPRPPGVPATEEPAEDNP
ncbi:MAG: NADH-quinone oxidoreductase subunit C [Actinomycetes bacterium]